MREWLLVFVLSSGAPGIAGPYTFEQCRDAMASSPRSFCVMAKDIRVTIRYPTPARLK